MSNTIYCKVLAKQHDIYDYHTLVFENLDNAEFGKNYVMCVVFPNWQSYIPEIGEVGYLNYKEVICGRDTWYDVQNNTFVPYNYSNLIFIKFVKEDKPNEDIIL